MTLTELRYIVTLEQERHFGRAAEKCFVAQPTLSVAVKKLEEELGVVLFERSPQEVRPTEAGRRVIHQAQVVLAEAARILEISASSQNALVGPLRLGTIPTVGPWLLPRLVPVLKQQAPAMPLLIEESFTHRLLDRLKAGDIDVAILALPFDQAGLSVQALYAEEFRVLLPADHPWAKRKTIPASELLDQSLLMLGAGNCFRDQVLDLCSLASADGGRATHVLEGSSLETIRHMVASGVGISVMPAAAVDTIELDHPLLRVRRFTGRQPSRTIALAWRSSFPRQRAIELIADAARNCNLPGTQPLHTPPKA